MGVDHAVACNCGTSALHVSLILAGVRADDEVIVPAVTFIAPVNAVRYVGAFPVFVDCDEYCGMDVAGIRRFLAEECTAVDGATVNRTTGRRVAAVIPVHVFGTSADMDAILDLAGEHDLAVIEDASEALGSAYKGRMCGGLAPIGCLSFNGNKIVTSGGGGAILTDDDALAEGARYLTTQAKEAGIEYIHHAVGYNYRMNNVLAALGLAQMETIDERVATKRENFALYEQALGPAGASRLLQQPAWSDANRWFYAYLCADAEAKDELLRACIAADIQARPLWYPNHLQAPYVGMQAYRIERALWFYERLVNLPCSVTLTQDEIAEVVAVIEASLPGKCRDRYAWAVSYGRARDSAATAGPAAIAEAATASAFSQDEQEPCQRHVSKLQMSPNDEATRRSAWYADNEVAPGSVAPIFSTALCGSSCASAWSARIIRTTPAAARSRALGRDAVLSGQRTDRIDSCILSTSQRSEYLATSRATNSSNSASTLGSIL